MAVMAFGLGGSYFIPRDIKEGPFERINILYTASLSDKDKPFHHRDHS